MCVRFVMRHCIDFILEIRFSIANVVQWFVRKLDEIRRRRLMEITNENIRGEEDEELGLFTKRFEKKWIQFSNNVQGNLPKAATEIPVFESSAVNSQKDVAIDSSPEKSRLESLHPDLLNLVICRVDHEDLTNLDQVSKSIREASLIAKRTHFDYLTPRPFRNTINLEEMLDEGDDIEVPNAPIRDPRRWTAGLVWFR